MAVIDGLVSLWPLDEATGAALDAHGANDLAETSGTIASATGKVSNARDFEAGDTEYFEIADNADLSTGNIDFSFACWVNAESLASNPVIAHKGWSGSLGANSEWVLFYSTGTSRFTFSTFAGGTTSVAADTLGVASPGTWYFIVVWHDAVNNVQGISVNAGTADTTPNASGVNDGTSAFQLGASASQALYWDGLIDEVGFWKKVLSSDERTWLYNGGSGRSYSDIVSEGAGPLEEEVPLQHALEVAAGDRFRDVAVDAVNSVGCWPLSEAAGTRAWNIVQPIPGQSVNHGVWENAGGVTRGVAMETIADGGLGATFDGTARVRVANDGEGYTVPGETAPRNLSMSGADGKVFAVIKTTTGDGTLRAIVQKQGAAGSNGWHLGVQSGAAVFNLRAGGVQVFNITGGTIDDNEEHIIYGHVDTDVSDAFARLYVDGVIVASATSITTEFPLTSADLLIGGFESGGGFIGTIGMVGVIREGDNILADDFEATRVWTDLMPHTRGTVEPLVARIGSINTDPLALVGGPGSLTVALDNTDDTGLGRPQGYFTPGHADAMVGWRERIPIRWRCSTDEGATWITLWRGFVEKISPTPGVEGSQHVSVLAYTWWAQALRAPLRPVPAQTAILPGEAIKFLLDMVKRPPPAIDIQDGDTEFTYWGDDLGRRFVTAEIAEVCLSEGGRCYERRDGTIVFESQLWRYVLGTDPAVWDADVLMPGFEADRGIESVINVIPLSWTPRRVGSAGTEIASMPGRIPIAPGEQIVIELGYKDPAQEAASIGATDVITPVVTTDYTMTSNADGSGDSLSGGAVVTLAAAETGGASSVIRVTNEGSDIGYFQTRLRGTPLYAFQPLQREFRNDASVREYDAKERPILLRYQGNADEARSFADRLIGLYKDPFMAARTAVLQSVSDVELAEILAREMGDPVVVEEELTALDDTSRWFIKGIELQLDEHDFLTATYTLEPGSAQEAFEILDEVGHAELGSFKIA